MTSPRRSEASLPALLADLYLAGTPPYRDDILRQTAQTTQRPAWSFPERWIPMQITMRLAPVARSPLREIALVGAVLLLLAALVAAYTGSQHPVPAPFGPARNGLIPMTRSGDLYLADPVSGAVRPLLEGPTDDHSAGFSPDGTLIGFIRGDGDVWVVRPDGTAPKSITGGSVASLTFATWTPDSRHLAVAGRFGGQQQLELFDARGVDAPKVLAADLTPDILTFRPPTGDEWLVRAARREQPGRMGLFAMRPDGTNVRTVIEPTVPISLTMDMNWPAYSPDGRVVYYTHSVDNGHIELWVMAPDGTGRHRFTHVDGVTWEGESVPSPDGRFVAFWQGGLDSGGGGRIGIARADGTIVNQQAGGLTFPLTTTAYMWSPDSSRLLVIPHADGSIQPYLIDPQGGAASRLPFQVDPDDPDWQRIAQ